MPISSPALWQSINLILIGSGPRGSAPAQRFEIKGRSDRGHQGHSRVHDDTLCLHVPGLGASLCGHATKQSDVFPGASCPHADVESVRSRLRTILSDSEVLMPSGDISATRVRAELDERDFGGIKIGQTVLVRSAAFREREFAGNVLSIAPIVQSSRISSRDQRNLTDISVAEVLIDLAEPGPLTVGMKVDVYFRRDNP